MAAPEASAAPAWRRHAMLLAKLAFMAGALWLVARHLDLPALGRTLRQARPGWLALAAVLFTASKLIASVRLNRFFKAVDINLSEGANLRLYWLGLYYNLFLPGGIGGDGYKVYRLGQQFPGRRAVIFGRCYSTGLAVWWRFWCYCCCYLRVLITPAGGG